MKPTRKPYLCHGSSGVVLQESGEWLVSGYLRARTLSANSLVHIPGLGDFQMAQVRATAPGPGVLRVTAAALCVPPD